MLELSIEGFIEEAANCAAAGKSQTQSRKWKERRLGRAHFAQGVIASNLAVASSLLAVKGELVRIEADLDGLGNIVSSWKRR